jgi:outer membrane lipoprotein-sorting protein
MEDIVKQLRYEARPEIRDRVLKQAQEALDEMETTGPAAGRPRIGRITMNAHHRKLALAAAAAILIVLGGITLWPTRNPDTGQWWLGPPAAWGQLISESLDKVQALVYREGYVFVGDYGSTHVSGNWSRWYQTADRRRRDKFYDDTLVSTMWEVPEDVGSVCRYDVSFEYECYTVQTYESGPIPSDPVKMLRLYVGLLDQADRVLGTETFEGKECAGFEVSAAKYGDNPEGWVDRIWFDTETKLPIRIEQHGRPVTDHPEQTFTFVKDEFEYYVDVPAEKFEPQIPEGFSNTHPDNIRAERELKEKGEMVFADVPPHLKDRLMAALDQAEIVAYTETGQTRVYLSRYAWCREHFDGDDLKRSEWYVIKQEDATGTSLDFNDESFHLVHTTVDYQNGTYKIVTHGRQDWPRHPLDSLRHPIGYIDRADRVLDDSLIEGIACFGLELSAKKYGTNPDGMIHRLWFSTETDLPVRMEFEFMNETSGRTVILVKDQFQWDPVLPDDFFVPQVPPEFTLATD